MKAARVLCLCLLTLAFAANAVAHLAGELPAGPPPGPTYTAAPAGGPWNLGTTWAGGVTPGPGAVVTIPANVTVTIDHIEHDPANAPKWVRVDGTLAVSTAVSTRFYVETIYVTETGLFSIGSPAAPLPMGRTAEIIFTSDGPIDKSWDREQISRGLVAEGRVKVHGISRTYAAAVKSDVPQGTQAMTLAVTPSNWQVGDEIVLTSTYFRRGKPPQDELRRISAISGTTLAADAAYLNDHLHVATAGQTAPDFHVANLTRNIVFRSHSTATIEDRGHVILSNSDSQIQWAAFINLGRTDKSRPLNDFIVGTASTTKQTDPNLVTNRRGRYAIHVHKAGWGPSLTTPQTNITGCVVNNTPGWGIANHSSNVDIRRNIVYDFFGAGFVTEDGDELGYFVNNIAIRGRGTGQFSRKSRINFANAERPQALADFGFMGDGFWFNGPAIRVNGAIASGCNGRGVIWHTTGAVSPGTATATYPFGRYSAFPKNQIVNVYGAAASTLQPRTWTGDTSRAVIADLPILLCTNVESYGNFIGFHLRFNNHDSIAWYNEDPFDYDTQIAFAPGQTNHASVPTRLKESISNLKLWNNEEAYAIRYAAFADWTNVTAINRLDYDDKNAANDPSLNPIYAAESFFQLHDMNFTGLTIDGWDVANWLSNIVNTGTNVTVTSPVYRNYALTGTWDIRATATPCSQPALSNVAVALNKQSATLNWTGAAGKYLVRYRITGAQQWTHAETTAKSLAITTTPSRNYEWQVIGGCANTKTLSNWTAKGAFSTF